ncbi:hypothetical protein [Mycobacterium leprae]|uniref:U1740h n=1 Tax=Mycobacterium leprae TaxID=1769 RepID=Q50064_MYCLR|nr:hypothetical protein [Mycobacterium leprae]AAA63020.1 u1740h [Mycobacterium leprae]OAR19852.1 hypothetical protein A8144_13370 [Mycobacterium leprae 3125609]OAX70189.1 hypothetical protein A3216_13395 [Mycobacterium leprae 7935681]
MATVLHDQDTARGGFHGAPKFSPSAMVEEVARAGSAMARCGVYDQLDGGFVRCGVDDAWGLGDTASREDVVITT